MASGRRTRILKVLLLAGAALASLAPALAQNAICDRLQAQIASLQRGDPGKSASYGRAAQKQQGEIERTSAYANSIGCSNRKFLFFGSNPPPQCGAVEVQIQRMRANLQQLLAQAGSAQGGSAAEINDLNYRYNSQCRAPPGYARALPTRPDNSANSMFDDVPPQGGRFQQVPLDPGPSGDSESDTGDGSGQRGGSKAVCVRTCDGGFFPVSYSARRGNLDELGDLCHALCPNADVKLFTYADRGEIDDAISQDGMAYSDMPNAFKFQKKFDATCSCKRPGQNWVDTLAEAERILGQSSRNDILVTQQKADELARPSAGAPAKASPRRKSGPPEVAVQEAKPAVPASDIPVIAADTPLLSTTEEAQFREVTGPDGIRRRVRIVGPKR